MQLKQELRLQQQLVMTPQLQQAIRLLQLSTMDLQQEIQKALESNPLLEMAEGENVAVVGPSGSGKSTLGNVLSGRDGYTVTGGSAHFKGQDLLELDVELRAREGLFLGFQYPVEIPGVSNINFLRTAINSIREQREEDPLSGKDFLAKVKECAQLVELDGKLRDRSVNEGFSGGEKKRNEIFQMAMLEPKLAVLDENNQPVANGTSGTLWFKTATEFAYHNDPEKTREATSADGSMTTVGDVGYVDDDGFLYLTDRKTFMIISGGVNIYPQECEDLLISHPWVADAAVFGVPNVDLGEEVKAVVQLMPGIDEGEATTEGLLAYLREHLSRQKLPRSIDYREALPRLPTGKLYKRLLRDEYWGDGPSKIV